jgi:hypothetical protein
LDWEKVIGGARQLLDETDARTRLSPRAQEQLRK